jgi:hypothetical protein
MNTVVGASKLTHPAVTATSADLLRVEDLRVVFPTAIAHGAARYQSVGQAG